MSPRRQPVVLSRASFVSLGLVCTLASAAFNVGVTWARVAAIEKAEEDDARRLVALEAVTAAHTTNLAVLATELGEIDKALARIDGRLSGTALPVTTKGRAP